MNLNQALGHMAMGRKIRLPEWEGFWGQCKALANVGLIEVHLKTGEVVYTPDFAQYGGREDWELVEE